ncbi:MULTISPECIES: phage pre-tape measure protein [Rhizobium]|jgi:hypothetical protein|uniref:phage pre-tape measure protein n=1 Tax=Rhizobium TaxID=379 RepID=UPI001030BF6E|nr:MULTISPECIES: hypothetical protein [Rhizobium]TBA16102.1 hypothetical protein ELH65_09035 [Rhizobium ruizarguesonis]TBE54470.1 hypothetical protein ELH04_08630 [Rhizobium leguminosarum]WSH59826.1 hypothetical protein U8P68_10895 [Rhizobium ruizarguesonis]
MAGLLDIAPVTETVTINGTAVDVPGVSAKGIAHLLARFPEIRMAMTGRGVDASRWLEIGGDAVAAIIAAGTGHPGEDEYEAAAGRLGIEAQADLIAAILKVTMPGGPGPFVEKLTAQLGLVGDLSNMAPATKSLKASKH